MSFGAFFMRAMILSQKEGELKGWEEIHYMNENHIPTRKTGDVQAASINPEVRSDAILTKFFVPNPGSQTKSSTTTDTQDENIQEGQPGWTDLGNRQRRQLIRFGGLFSEVGNKLGGFSARVTRALDKVCEVIKTIIPVVAAVCHVGHFQFCGSINEAPQEFAEVLAPNNIDLNIPDK